MNLQMFSHKYSLSAPKRAFINGTEQNRNNIYNVLIINKYKRSIFVPFQYRYMLEQFTINYLCNVWRSTVLYKNVLLRGTYSILIINKLKPKQNGFGTLQYIDNQLLI